MKPIFALLASITLLASAARPALAEVFILAGGGQVVGEWLNRDETPRRQYVVQVADGAKVTLDATQVEKVLHPRPDEAEYERIRPTYADTAAAQWELAQWCREHKLTAQRETHLRRVIELEPNNVEARRALGYTQQADGQWATTDEIMIQRGYRKYKGAWKLPQEIEALENRRNLEVIQQEWFQKMKLWRGWLGTKRDQEAHDNIRAIKDPAAVRALTLGLRDDADSRARMLFVETLGKINAPEAGMALAIAAMSDNAEEVRSASLDCLESRRQPEVTAYFVKKLYDKKDNAVVNLAGVALGRVKDPSAIGPLIDRLVTVHQIRNPMAPEGSTSASFGSGPKGGSSSSGMSTGGPKFLNVSFQNQAVLDALTAITGQGFGFDQQLWRQWYAAQRKPPDTLDARRN